MQLCLLLASLLLVSAQISLPPWRNSYPGTFTLCTVYDFEDSGALASTARLNCGGTPFNNPNLGFEALQCPASFDYSHISRCSAAQSTNSFSTDMSTTFESADSRYCDRFLQAEIQWGDPSSAVCYDAFGLTCGGQAGVKTMRANWVGYSSYGSLSLTPFAFGVGYRYCVGATYSWPCVTPACPAPPPLDCRLKTDYGPWSQCYAVNDKCIQSRVKEIDFIGEPGGTPCPSLTDRTQEIPCPDEEMCTRILCTPDIVWTDGQCNVTCGVGHFNQTLREFSNVPLERCKVFNRILSYAEYPCDTNMPCQDIDPSLPVVPVCSIVGYQGYMGSAPKYINLSFTGGQQIVTNYSGFTLASVFKAEHFISKREFTLVAVDTVVSNNYILLRLDIPDANAQGLSGDPFKLTYDPNPLIPGSLTVDGYELPLFTCVTDDLRPPVMMYAMYDNRESTRRITFVFSEPVFDCADPESTAISSPAFYYVGTTSLSTTGYTMSMETPYRRVWRRSSVSGSASFAEGAYVGMNASALCDAAGNPSEFNEAYRAYLLLQRIDSEAVYPSGAYLSHEVFVNKSIGNGVDYNSVILTFPYAISIDDNSYPDVLSGIKVGMLDSSGTTVIANSTVDSWKREYASSAEIEFGLSIRLIFTFPPLTSNVFYEAINVNLSAYRSIYGANQTKPTFIVMFDESVFGPSTSAISYFGIPGVWQPVWTRNITVGLSQSPTIRRALALIGTPTLTIALTAPQANNLTCNDIWFGNRTCVVVETSPLIATFNITGTLNNLTSDEPFVQNDLYTPLIYKEANNTGASPPSNVLLESATGPPPIVSSASVVAVGDSGVANVVNITFPSTITELSGEIEEAVTLTSSSPNVVSVDVTGYTIVDNSLLVTFTPTCVGGCIDIDATVSNLSVSVADKITGSNGLVSQPVTIMPVVDRVRPRIASALEIDKGVVVVTITEPVSAYSTLGIVPTPARSFNGQNNSYACVFGEAVTAGSIFQVSAGAISDVFGNKPQFAQGKLFKFSDFDNSCDPWKQWYMIFMVTVTPFIVGGSIFGYVKLYRQWPSSKM